MAKVQTVSKNVKICQKVHKGAKMCKKMFLHNLTVLLWRDRKAEKSIYAKILAYHS